MTSEDTILTEIKHMRSDFLRLDRRMDGLEKAVNMIAVQSTRIDGISHRITELKLIDDRQDKELKSIARFQGGCVRHTFESVVEKQWTAIKVLAGAMVSGFGILGAFIRWAG
jgi:uncharacterized coiled-coil protein SlyX